MRTERRDVRQPSGLWVPTELRVLDPVDGLAPLPVHEPTELIVGSDFVERDGLWLPKIAAWQAAWDLAGGALIVNDALSALSSMAATGQSAAQAFGQIAAALRNSYVGLLAKVDEPEHDSTRVDPFIGYKTLCLVEHWRTDGLQLQGSWGHPYGIDATATCGNGGAHLAPDWECSCGFYALKEPPSFDEFGAFLAEVELFGRVIEGEFGYRAARQRVLRLSVRRVCSRAACEREADRFIQGGYSVVPVCKRHRKMWTKSVKGRSWTLADLTAAIGTEVVWREP